MLVEVKRGLKGRQTITSDFFSQSLGCYLEDDPPWWCTTGRCCLVRSPCRYKFCCMGRRTDMPNTRTSPSPSPYASHFPKNTASVRYQCSEPRKSLLRLTFTQTGISGNTLSQTLTPFNTLSFFLSAASALFSCFAVMRAETSPATRTPYSPNASDVPFDEPPVGRGTRPLWYFLYFIRRGARSPRARDAEGTACWIIGAARRKKDSSDDMAGSRMAVARFGKRRMGHLS